MAAQHHAPAATYDPYSYSTLHPLDIRADTAPDFAQGASSDTHILITKTAIAWIIVISILATASLAFSAWLLCGCCSSRRSKAESTQPLDDRNEFFPWNPAAPWVAGEDEGEGEGEGQREEGMEMMPLSKKERKGRQGDLDAFLRAPGTPRVVERAEGGEEMQRKSRYHSRGGDGIWRRYSQMGWIGKAQ
ncbi:hypothetical protein LTR86_005274 [Recurvomyces mirabilis]|nr:hypothetical protein LTR86_005274 [Recurvomyces mirabilis]